MSEGNLPSKRGRKSKLTPEVAKRICGVLANGNYIQTACAMVNIDPSQFHRWMEKGEHQTDGEYRDFHDAVKQAEQRAELECLRQINEDPSWQSKAWVLERRYPERWGRKDRLDSNVNSTVEVTFNTVKEMSHDEWKNQVESQ